jgi:hypothetical protein
VIYASSHSSFTVSIQSQTKWEPLPVVQLPIWLFTPRASPDFSLYSQHRTTCNWLTTSKAPTHIDVRRESAGLMTSLRLDATLGFKPLNSTSVAPSTLFDLDIYQAIGPSFLIGCRPCLTTRPCFARNLDAARCSMTGIAPEIYLPQ